MTESGIKARRLTVQVLKPRRTGDRVGAATGPVARIAVDEAIRTRRAARRQRKIVTAAGVAADGPANHASGIERLVAEARERVLQMARKTGAGLAQPTVLGRLAATGEISRRQFEAGRRYAAIVRDQDAQLGFASGDRAKARGRGEDSAAALHARCRTALRDAGREDPMAGAVVDAVVVNDWELPDLTPALRIGLNHLARTLDAIGVNPPVGEGWPAIR